MVPNQVGKMRNELAGLNPFLKPRRRQLILVLYSMIMFQKSYTRALFGSPLLYLFIDQVNILEPGR